MFWYTHFLFSIYSRTFRCFFCFLVCVQCRPYVPTQAGGNDALALLLTVTTNLLGVVTVPFFVKLVISAGDEAEIDAVQLLVKLVSEILQFCASV